MFVSGGSQVGDAGDQATLGLKVTNFGPIVEADIELRPLTVFVGPSNTGKSYLAILIYALHALFAGTQAEPHWSRLGRSSRFNALFRDRPARDPLSDAAAQQLADWWQTAAEASESAAREARDPLPENVATLVRSSIEARDATGRALSAEIERCFGADIGQLIRREHRGDADITLRPIDADSLKSAEGLSYQLALGRRTASYSATLPAGAPLRLSADTPIHALIRSPLFRGRFGVDERDTTAAIAKDLLSAVSESVMSRTVEPLSWPAFYLPADRAGVMHAHRVVVSALLQHAASGGLRRTPALLTLPGFLADFLEQLIEMDSRPARRRPRGRGLADDIERDVLKGAVEREASETGYPSYFYRPDGWKQNLPLMNSSSMVSELAPVVLYLRHLVGPGHTLIIEEPESHLHPAMQAEFALHLARLVRAGIRIIVTTHSEWVLDQFANLIRMSDLPESDRESLAGTDAVLHPKQFGAWLFEPKKRPRGSMVREIRVDSDSGGLMVGYGDVAEQLYQTWAWISNRIGDGEE